jgi:hypothetical protein
MRVIAVAPVAASVPPHYLLTLRAVSEVLLPQYLSVALTREFHSVLLVQRIATTIDHGNAYCGIFKYYDMIIKCSSSQMFVDIYEECTCSV